MEHGERLSENRCSFCGRSEQEVKRLIAGQGAFICDECVALCNEVLTADGPSSSGIATPSSTQARGWLKRKPRQSGYRAAP